VQTEEIVSGIERVVTQARLQDSRMLSSTLRSKKKKGFHHELTRMNDERQSR
jgi:hypothetical protein